MRSWQTSAVPNPEVRPVLATVCVITHAYTVYTRSSMQMRGRRTCPTNFCVTPPEGDSNHRACEVRVAVREYLAVPPFTCGDVIEYWSPMITDIVRAAGRPITFIARIAICALMRTRRISDDASGPTSDDRQPVTTTRRLDALAHRAYAPLSPWSVAVLACATLTMRRWDDEAMIYHLIPNLINDPTSH